MNLEQLSAYFDKYEDEFLDFDVIEKKLSKRHDMHAFILLDKLVPGTGQFDMIESAQHDQIYLGIEPERLAMAATEQDILELVRCGISYDPQQESFYLFT